MGSGGGRGGERGEWGWGMELEDEVWVLKGEFGVGGGCRGVVRKFRKISRGLTVEETGCGFRSNATN